MNKKAKQVLSFFVLLITLFLIFYLIEIPTEKVENVFLTVSTFLFAILVGFFTSRQSVRHEDIRERISQFDGNLTSLYRSSGIINEKLQEEIGEIVKNHYKIIVDRLEWDYHFNNKSDTITKIHETLKDDIGGKSLDDLGKAVLAQMQWSLRDLQRVRKDMVSLYQERIPVFQWALLFLLAAILILTITSIPSHLFFFGSILKSAFVLSVIAVLMLLNRLNRMKLFEGTIGLSSARDAIDIIDNKK